MIKIFLLALITGLLFLISLSLLIFGIIRKTKKIVVLSLVVFILFIGSFSWSLYLFINKSYSNLTFFLKPRSGREIYFALFGKTDNQCLKILRYQDQIIPKIDYEIRLYFETCPEELNRILKFHAFESKVEHTKDWISITLSNDEDWFRPETLGDSIIVFLYKKDDYGNYQTLYSSMDSTKIYCIDILD